MSFRKPAFIVGASIAAAIIAINAGIAVSIFSAAHHEATSWPGKSFTFWPERDWRQVERRLDSLRLPARMESLVLGEVDYREGAFPVRLVRIAPARAGAQPLKVLLVSGIHGTETAGVEALLQFTETMARSPSRNPSVFLDIIPIANPWGWVYGYRYDGEGQDVNRDFASHRTQEARLVQDLMRRDGPFDLVMDLHESKKYGYFIYQYVSPDEGLGGEYVKLLGSLGDPRESNYREWIFPARDGILQTPPAALFWIALGRSLSLEQYARLHGVRHSYTVETPVRDVFDERVAVHLKTVQTFIGSLVAGQTGK